MLYGTQLHIYKEAPNLEAIQSKFLKSVQVYSISHPLTQLELGYIFLGAPLRFCFPKFWLKQVYWGTSFSLFILLDKFSSNIRRQINDNLACCGLVNAAYFGT